MDLNKRLDLVDDEFKLLKNEIKQVLLDIQEKVLSIENPFAGVGGDGASAKPANDGAILDLRMRLEQVDSEMQTLRNEMKNEVNDELKLLKSEMKNEVTGELRRLENELKSEILAKSQALPQSVAGPTSQSSYPSAAPAPGASVPSSHASSVQHMGELEYSEPRPVSKPSRRRRAKADRARAATNDGLDDGIGETADDYSQTSDVSEARDLSDTPTHQQVSDNLDQEESEAASTEDVGEIREIEESDTQGEGQAHKRSRKARATAAGKVQSQGPVDLATLMGLASWTDQAVSRIGREQLEPLSEISEIRGRLSKEVKEIVLALARLFDGLHPGSELTAKEMVSLLAQLDALSGSGISADAKLLPLLFQGDLEGFPLIPP